MNFSSMLVGVNFLMVTLCSQLCFGCTGFRYTHEDREVKRQLGKFRPRAYSDLIRSDIPGSSGVSPSCSPYLRSPPPPAMETSPEGPPAVKTTREEL